MKLRELLSKPMSESGPYDLPGVDYDRAGDTPRKLRSRGGTIPRRHPDDPDFMDPDQRRIRADQARVAKAQAEYHAKKKRGVAEDYESEGHTVKNSLHTIIRVATHLERQIDDSEDFAEWESEAIGSIKDQMVKVMDYEISKKEQQGMAEGGNPIQAAIAIAKKKSGKYDKDGKRLKETASIGTTNSSSIPSVANPKIANSKKKVKSVSALDQNSVSLFGGPMENIQAPIIKRR